VSKALKAHLDDFESKRKDFKFSAKRDQINRADLAVVVFVQDDKTKHVLQAPTSISPLLPELGPPRSQPTAAVPNEKTGIRRYACCIARRGPGRPGCLEIAGRRRRPGQGRRAGFRSSCWPEFRKAGISTR